MKRIALLFVFVFMACSLVLTGCGQKGFKENPSGNDTVIGNGGLVVQQGQFVYFANGYDTYENASKDMTKGALYRAKLDNQYYASLDENNYLTNAEKVSGRLVGYAMGGIYLFDGYIYYATPNMEKDKEGNTLKNYIDFYRVKLDGTDEKRLYTSNGSMEEGDWGMVKVDQTVYFVVYNGDSLVSVVANGKKATTNTIATGVTSFAITHHDTYSASNYQTTDAERYVWYTRSLKEDEQGQSGNVLARCALGTTNEQTIKNDTNTYSVVDIVSDKVYVNVTSSTLGTTKLVSYQVSNISDESMFSLQNATDTYILDNMNMNAVVFNNNGVFEMYAANNGYVKTISVLSGATVVDVLGTTIYYVKEGVLSCVDVLTLNNKTICGDSEVAMPDDATLYDIDGRNIYFVRTYTNESSEENQYLNRWDMQKSSPVFEMFGTFADGDAPVLTEEEEE